MKHTYTPKSNLENFGQQIYFLLVENFPETFFVGGTVRDILLKKKVKDVDIATSAKPESVAEILKDHFIDFNFGYKNLGVVLAVMNNLTVAIATFRKETYTGSRYPKIQFIKSPKQDSQRRDFSINSLYLSLKNNLILDFHKGLNDLKNKQLRFINDPKIKITEDPLRIVRALRFASDLNFKIENKSFLAIKNKLSLVKLLTKSRVKTELNRVINQENKKNILLALENEKNLDKYFKKR